MATTPSTYASVADAFAKPHQPDTPAPVRDQSAGAALRHCSPDTIEAASAFRATGDTASLRALAASILGPFVSDDRQDALAHGGPALRLAEDLGIDSLDLTEIGMVSEDMLGVSIGNDELFATRTLGDLESLFERLLRSQPRSGMRLPPECGGHVQAGAAPLPGGPRSTPTK